MGSASHYSEYGQRLRVPNRRHRRRQYEGTGLGLPLTKALVELHGGTLDLQSEAGVGSTVTMRFPVERIVASLDHADALDRVAN